MLREAKRRSAELGAIKNSITKGAGNLAGYLAEVALAAYIKGEVKSCDEGSEKFDYDILKNGLKIECKTKRRSVDPKPEYEVSIASTSKHQKPDVYAFLSVTFKKKTGRGRNAIYTGVDKIWLCGYMKREEYFDKANYMNRGQIDISNGFRTHQNMQNLPISELHDTYDY